MYTETYKIDVGLRNRLIRVNVDQVFGVAWKTGKYGGRNLLRVSRLAFV